MMNITILIETVLFAFCIYWFFLFWVIFYRQYRIDEFRQRVFALRDELFDYAADGAIEFENPAYVKLRRSMNGAIRFAESLTLWQILIYYVFTLFSAKETGEHPKVDEVREEIQKIGSQTVRDALSRYLDALNREILRCIVKKSVLLLILVAIIALLIHCAAVFDRMKSRLYTRVLESKIFKGVLDQSYIAGGRDGASMAV